MKDISKHQFLALLEKYRLGNASAGEEELIQAYFKAFEFEPDLFNTLPEPEQNQLEAEIRAGIEAKIAAHEQVTGEENKANIWVKWAVAASVLLLTFASFIIFRMQHAVEPAALVTIKQPAVKLNKLVQLPDGSTVILSAQSKIDYPTTFDGHLKREVYLVGQAFFDIKHNPDKPFIVHTGEVETIVLGTAFNITAWPQEKDISVTVTRGKVKVGNQQSTLATLTPNQQLIYNQEKKQSQQTQVNAEKIVAWKAQDLFFDDVTLANAAHLLEERYNISILIPNDRLKHKRFTSTLGASESLESILKGMAEFNNATYTYSPDHKQIILSPK
jgi:transmembrane sensor